VKTRITRNQHTDCRLLIIEGTGDQMGTLTGKQAEEFVEWLDDIRFLLPPKMRLSECRELFERKLKEENEIKNEE